MDTDGRGLVLDPQPADVRDRDGAVPMLKRSRRSYQFIVEAFADAGYAGDTTRESGLPAQACRRYLGEGRADRPQGGSEPVRLVE